jgi:Zn-dependent protease/CBS domain-containing protein
MEPTVKVGKVFGIDFYLGYSWFLIFVFATIVLAMQFDANFPGWTPTRQFIWGLATSALFFASILGHEIAHSLVSLYHKIRVHSITLHIFGGYARLSRPARNPFEEFTIAIAGPIASMLISVFFTALWIIGEKHYAPLAVLAGRLAWINIVLAIFNTLPAFPLDGGLILRALFWRFHDDYTTATRHASYISLILSAAFMLCGIFFFLSFGLMGLWFLIIGYNFLISARMHLTEARIKENFRAYKVGNLALRQLPQISSRASVREFLDATIFGNVGSCYLVVDENVVAGMVSVEQAGAVNEDHYTSTSIGQVMTPLSQLEIIDPETNVAQALELMDCMETAQLPVVRDQQLQGFISRELLVEFIREHFDCRQNGSLRA